MARPRSPAGNWLLLYDADCRVCGRLLSWVMRWDRDRRFEPVALRSRRAETLLADLTPERRFASWHLISPDGERFSAGAALAPLLRLLPGGAAPAAVAARFPATTERGYRFVAGHRGALSRLIGSGPG